MILGNRIDREAYHNIRHLHQRFFINREKSSDFSYWMLYAPIINNDGEIIAIANIPYAEGDQDFHREAFLHAALLINIFVLLLIISLLFSTREVNELFEPLMEMGKKMSISDIHHLQPINYKKVDEISSVVDAYNRMVKELADARRYAIEDTVQPFFAVYDFLAMAEMAAAQSDNVEAIRQGLMMIIAEYRKAFEELNLKPFDAKGAKFDPALHDAVAHESSTEVEEGVVSKQWNCGFKLGEKVLRPARVVVSSGAPKEEEKKEE